MMLAISFLHIHTPLKHLFIGIDTLQADVRNLLLNRGAKKAQAHRK